jgi:hypothetical protein
MAKTNSERQSAWRRRRDFNATAFHEVNRTRKAGLIRQWEKDPFGRCPEEKAVLVFFLNYHHCFTFPCITFHKGSWQIDRDGLSELERAAALVAFEDITRNPAYLHGPVEMLGTRRDPAGGFRALGGEDPFAGLPMEVLTAKVSDDVAEMRRRGLWDSDIFAKERVNG